MPTSRPNPVGSSCEVRVDPGSNLPRARARRQQEQSSSYASLAARSIHRDGELVTTMRARYPNRLVGFQGYAHLNSAGGAQEHSLFKISIHPGAGLNRIVVSVIGSSASIACQDWVSFGHREDRQKKQGEIALLSLTPKIREESASSATLSFERATFRVTPDRPDTKHQEHCDSS